MTDQQRDKRVEKAQLRILFRVPFFAPAVARLPVTWDDTIKTACTDGNGIRFSRAFGDGMTDDQLCTVLAHEACHCLFGHLWRAPAGVDWDTWNQATDHAVNLMLKEFSAQVVAKNLADPFPFPDPQDAYCANPAFSGLAEEVIYARLAASQPPGGGGSGKPGQGQGQGKPAPGSMPSFGQMQQPQPGQAASPSNNKLRNDWANTMIQACSLGKGRGDLPGGIGRFVDTLVSSQVPWYQVLASWVREQCSDDYDWLRPAMEYEGSGFILPGMHADKVGKIVFATDTSGSIDNEVLAHFQVEKQQVLDELKPRALVDIYCDSKIHKVSEYTPGDTIDKEAPGGGGTDLRKVFDYIEGLKDTPKCLVVLTDLDTPFPATEPSYPTLWVSWTKDGKAPFGEVIYAG